jgi:hypothetical protein
MLAVVKQSGDDSQSTTFGHRVDTIAPTSRHTMLAVTADGVPIGGVLAAQAW